MRKITTIIGSGSKPAKKSDHRRPITQGKRLINNKYLNFKLKYLIIKVELYIKFFKIYKAVKRQSNILCLTIFLRRWKCLVESFKNLIRFDLIPPSQEKLYLKS